ncbi:uncharacterized protein [Miscanthus floridulus]|uniref:uncharacterized protein n=1 Tax=Miscanthus floridulus TaxID=154761 RepID=UPI0034578A59
MYNHEWLEYSIKKDAAFCFICYLFKKGSGSEAFTVDGWNNWNIGEPALLKHLGSKAHIAAQERYIGFINPKVAIDYNIQKWSDEDLRLYKKRLTFSLRCIKFLLHQGLAFRGHDESKESSNRGNFIELLKFLARNSEEVNKYVLDNAPDCSSFFDQVSILLNIIGVSCKRHDMLRKARLENIKKALDCGEIESGTGLHQEMGLSRPGDTRWGSHYKTICSILTMYESIHDVLVDLGDDPTYKDDWTKIHFVTGAFETFEFVFFVHLMYIILGYTNELSKCLQRREQDILNAISLVNVAKKRMQQLRSDGWNTFLEKVTSFCDKHGVDVPAMDGVYVPYGKSTRKARARKQTNDDHFRREVYIGVIDQISQELDNQFDEINMELLSCMVAFNPSKSFESFDAQKLRRLAEFYPKDFSKNNLRRLELQLDNYIDDIKQDDRFKGLENIVDLSVKLVQTKRHKVYDMVYELLKLVLLLPVATASVERMARTKKIARKSTGGRVPIPKPQHEEDPEPEQQLVQYGPVPAMVEYRSRKFSHPVHTTYWLVKAFVKTWSAEDGAWKDDNDRYFPRRRAEASSCRVAKLEEGESARLAATVPLVVTLNSALDRSMLDQRSLWIEVESLQSKVDEYKHQQQ